MTRINANHFSYLNNLEYLDLDYNQLRVIDEKAFINLENLQVLLLYSNKFEKLSFSVFKPISQTILIIDLSNNTSLMKKSFINESNIPNDYQVWKNNKWNKIDEIKQNLVDYVTNWNDFVKQFFKPLGNILIY